MITDKSYIFNKMIERYGETWLKTFPQVVMMVSKYINDRQDILSTRNYGKHIIFTEADKNRFYQAAGIDDEKEVIQIINDSPNIDHKIPDQVNPIYNVLYVMFCFYHQNHNLLIKQVKNKNINPSELLQFFLGLRVWSICQRQIFPHEPRQLVVDYTLEHLTMKYVLIKYNNLYDFILGFVKLNFKDTDKISFNLDKPVDVNIYQYINKLIGRFKSLLKNLFRATQVNGSQNNVNLEEDIQASNKETGKSFFVVNSNVSNTIEIICNKIVTNFIQEPVIRMNLVKVACKKSQSSTEKVRIILTDIRTSKDNELLTRVIRDILSYWIVSLTKDSSSIHSVEFIKRCSIAYSISNTSDPFIIDLKDTLLTILNKYSSRYVTTASKTSVNGFKQSVFLYLVLYISANS